MKTTDNNFNPYALTYLVIPDYAYRDTRLTLIALKIYGFIHSYTNPFFFGNENIAKMFGCSERSVTEALTKLEEYGYIVMRHTPKAGGGTTRLAVDCQSDWKSSSSRKQKFQATTSSPVLHKESKDNNIKEKNFSETPKEEPVQVGNNLTPSQKRELKKQRAEAFMKSKGLGFSPNDPSPKRNDYRDNPPKKGGVDARHII